MNIPWDDCKIAFSINEPDFLWEAVDESRITFPKDWELNETARCGAAGYVAIFRVSTIPTVEDGKKVANILKRF